MIERDTWILALGLLIPDISEAHRMVKAAMESALYDGGFIKNKLHTSPENIRLIIGDVRSQPSGSYDVIFHDAYSPRHNWELYSVQLFTQLSTMIEKDGVILTYSSSTPMRSSLLDAGFAIGGTPPHKRRRSGTIASPTDNLPDLSRKEERVIALTDRGVPYVEGRETIRKNLRNRILFSSSVPPCFENIYDFGEKFSLSEREEKKAARGIRKMGMTKKEIMYIVCPQYKECICGKCVRPYKTTTERIKEMKYRLLKVKEVLIDTILPENFERFKTDEDVEIYRDE
jgi:hypothetical protein